MELLPFGTDFRPQSAINFARIRIHYCPSNHNGGN
jgi:hypothetical protein